MYLASGHADIEEWREVLVAKSALAPGEGLGGRSVKGVFVGLWKRPSDGMVRRKSLTASYIIANRTLLA